MSNSFAKISGIIAPLGGNTIISIDTLTEVKLKGGKSNPYQGRVQKLTIGNTVQIFANKTTNGYENMVKRRLVGEGKDPNNFELSPRAWGTRLEGIPFVEHKGEHYLEVIFIKPGETSFLLDGEEIDPEDIEGLECAPIGGEQGGLEDKVVLRTFKCDSILRIKAFGQEHYLK